jgi:putative transposase
LSGLKKNLVSNNTAEARKAMAEPDDQKINLSRQAKLLSINRTSLYRGPAASAWAEVDFEDMRIIDEIYTSKPYYGYRRITEEMDRYYGRHLNRKRVRRLMRVMGIAGISPGPNLSKLLHAKYVRPYLLRGLKTTHPDQVWAVDITYVRLEHGFMYL